MTQDEARDLIYKIRFIAQKTRSILMEALAVEGKPFHGDPDHSNPAWRVGNSINKYIFPDNDSIGILPACQLYLDKPRLEAIDMFNLLTMCHMEDAFVLAFSIVQGIELPKPMQAFVGMMTVNSA